MEISFMGNKTSRFAFRINKTLKYNFDEFCKNTGLSSSTAINIFVRRSIDTNTIPFAIETKNLLNLQSKEEMNSQINVRMEPDAREQFKKICEKIGIPMSVVVKMFMVSCIENNSFPFDL